MTDGDSFEGGPARSCRRGRGHHHEPAGAGRHRPRFDSTTGGRQADLSGNVQTTNIVRHPEFDLIRYPTSFDRMQFIQQRNVLRTRLDWELVAAAALREVREFLGSEGRTSSFCIASHMTHLRLHPELLSDYDVHGRDIRNELAKEQALGRSPRRGHPPLAEA